MSIKKLKTKIMFLIYTSERKNIRFLLFILLFLLFYPFYPQAKTKLDSISKIISSEKSDSVKLRLHKELCILCSVEENPKYGKLGLDFTEKLINQKTKELTLKNLLESKLYFLEIIRYYYKERKDFFEQLQLNKQIIETAKKIQDTFLLEERYIQLAQNLQQAGLAQAAFDTLFSRLKKYENVSKRINAFYLNNIGDFYYNNYNNEKALQYYQKAFPYYLENKKYERASEILSKISEQYDLLGQKEQAIKGCLQNLKLIEKVRDQSGKINIFWRLSNLYIGIKNMDSGLSVINQILLIANKSKDKYGLAMAYGAMSYFYKSKNEKVKQEEYILKCLRIYEEMQSENNIMYRLIDLSAFYIDNGNYQKSLTSSERGLKLAEKLKDIDSQKTFWNLLYIGYKKLNRASEALTAFEAFKTMEDSLKNFLNQSAIQTREQTIQFEKKQNQFKLEQERKEIISKEEKQKQTIIRNALILILIVISILVLFIYKNFRLKKASNHSLTEQNKIISLQKQEVEIQKHLVEEKQKEILDSIHYAKRLQEAILPPLHFINEHAPNNFVLYQPKDVVAGDFYWAETKDNKFFIAAADCTGHGVPGAMVSVVCSNALNRTVNEFGITDTGEILDKTRELVLETFTKGNSEVKDGMDISLLCIDKQNNKAFWSGANNPLWYVSCPVTSSEVEKSTDAGLDSARPDTNVGSAIIVEIKADKQPIGKSDHAKPFTTNEITLQKGMLFYLFTDGFADQFGGPKGKKFKYKQLEELLLANANKSMNEQHEILIQQFNLWKGDLEQIDDVCVIGVRL